MNDSPHIKKKRGHLHLFSQILFPALLFYIDGQRNINEGRIEKPLLTTNSMNLFTNHSSSTLFTHTMN